MASTATTMRSASRVTLSRVTLLVSQSPGGALAAAGASIGALRLRVAHA